MMLQRLPGLAMLALLGGCASIVGSNSQPITINSALAQAEISIHDEDGVEVFRGMTPTTVTLKKSGGYFNGRDYTVSFTKVGYGEQTAVIGSRPNGWYILGNLVFGGVIGWLIVDPATGAMWTLSPDTLAVSLLPEPGARISQDDGEPAIRLTTIDSLDPALRSKLVPLR